MSNTDPTKTAMVNQGLTKGKQFLFLIRHPPWCSSAVKSLNRNNKIYVKIKEGGGRVVVFNAPLNNISVISWRSVFVMLFIDKNDVVRGFICRNNNMHVVHIGFQVRFVPSTSVCFSKFDIFNREFHCSFSAELCSLMSVR